MNRNVTILVIILLILVIGGFLLWLRGKFQVPEPAPVTTVTEQVTATPSPTATIIASPSATATPSGVKASPTVTKSVTKAATSSGKTVNSR